MKPIDKLEQAVQTLYQDKRLERDDWADWMYPNHVLVTADHAVELARRFKVDIDLCRAAGLLHDAADAVMSRLTDPAAHERKSLELAREYMLAAGFSNQDIEQVIDDAIRYHSCHGSDRPQTMVGKVLATADSLAHLKTDFYRHALWQFAVEGRSLDFYISWLTKKLENDFTVKIQFDEVRNEVRPDYESLKAVLLR